MKDRIRLFLEKENITSSQFASRIGVQPSAVSHVLSGRNKPSLDFVLKMLNTYDDLNSDWLLFGKGEMYNEGLNPLLFEDEVVESSDIETDTKPKNTEKGHDMRVSDSEKESEEIINPFTDANKPFSERIMIFYEDGTYKEYKPRK